MIIFIVLALYKFITITYLLLKGHGKLGRNNVTVDFLEYVGKDAKSSEPPLIRYALVTSSSI